MTEVMELELIPIPPDTAASVEEEIIPLAQQALSDAGHERLLSEDLIQIHVQRGMPLETTVIVFATFMGPIAGEIFRAFILERWKGRYELRVISDRGKPVSDSS